MKTSVMPWAIIALLIFVAQPFFAQKSPFKWGKVDKADLAMTVYEPDTSAEAVVLFDYGKTTMDFNTGRPRTNFEHHRRVKILKRSGFEYADVSISFYHGDQLEVVNQVKAQVIQPDGEVIQLKKSEIIEEKISDNWSQIKFSFPGIKEGSIVEYRYKKHSQILRELEEWYFQEYIPVRWSEYHVAIPTWYRYVSLTQGRKLDINEKELKEEIVNVAAGEIRTTRASGKTEVSHQRMVMKNVPALRPEPYITTMDDYFARVRFQLSGTMFEVFKPIMSDWLKVSEDLMESESFGKQLTQGSKHNKVLEASRAVVKADMSELEKLYALYNFVNREIEWNEYLGIYAGSNLDKCFDEKTGSKQEMNLMLTALLKGHGLSAWPVLVSTRDNGRPVQMYPILDQFNYLIVAAQVDDKVIWLDTGNPNRKPGLVNLRSLNQAGFLVDKELAQWIQFSIPESRMACIADLKLDVEGTLSGNLKNFYSGYYSSNLISSKESKDDKAFFDEWLKEVYPDGEVVEANFKAKGAYGEKLEANLNCDIPGSAMGFDEFLYVSPILFPIFNENPLKLENREFPVDFPYPFMEQFMINLQIPEGYDVEELPESKLIEIEGGGGRLKFVVSQPEPDKLQIICQFKIAQLHFEPEEYPGIKQLFDKLMEAQESQIVLKKRT